MNVKNVIENVVDATGTAAQAAANKSKQVYAIAKAKLEIGAANDKIRKAELELGKLYYKDFAAGAEPDAAAYLPWCDKITEAKKEIEALKEKIEELKRMQIIEGKVFDADDDDIDVEIFAVDPPVEVADEAAPEAEAAPADETPDAAPADAEPDDAE